MHYILCSHIKGFYHVGEARRYLGDRMGASLTSEEALELSEAAESDEVDAC